MIYNHKHYTIYAVTLSSLTPLAMLYNLSKIYQINLSSKIILRGTLSLFPTQYLMKTGQIYLSTHLTDISNNHLIGFSFIGLSQGIIYNNCIHHWMHLFNIPKIKIPSHRGLFFSIPRDIISQGVPYQFANPYTLIPISITSTILTQGLHNCQIHMQTNKNINYSNVLQKIYKYHGISFLYKGVFGRIVLLTITNIVNYTCLKIIWN